MLLRQMIAIVCALTVGVMIITSFVSEDAAADDYTMSLVLHITRVTHDNGIITHYVSREIRDIVPHIGDGESHQHRPPALTVVFHDESCSDSECSRCS